MSDYRIETDSLGTLEIPHHVLWGIQTQRALHNFPISGLKPYPAFVWAQVMIKRAAAEVNHTLGLFADHDLGQRTITGTEIAQAIMSAADEVLAGQWSDQFVVDPFQAGAGTSHNMNVNEVLANRANQLLGFALADEQKPIHPNDHVNMAQSTNDTIPTAIRLGCLWRLDELTGALANLQRAFEQKAAEFDDVVKSGRTHLQDAVPVRLGQEFGAYAKAVERSIIKVEQAADGLRRLGIGGTATGTGLNAHPAYHARMVEKLRDLTGLELHTSDNLFESMQSMQDAVFFSGALRTLAQDLIRIANDLRLLSSGPATGLNEINLPAVQPGSSIMPGKVNPVLAEMLNMVMFHVIGNDHTVLLAGQAGQLELNVMMPVIAHNLFEMMHITIGAVTAFTHKCVTGITVNREQAEGWLAKNAILVTALNPIIGYAQGSEVAKRAMASGRSILDIVVEQGYLSEEEARDILKPYQMTEGKLQR